MANDPSGIDPHFDYLHGILRNIPGFTAQAILDRFEAAESAEALVRLQISPVSGSFDALHLKEIHKRIFQNIYPWAGEFRKVNIRRSGSYFFALVPFIEPNLENTLSNLASENRLKGLALDAFAERSAYFLGELNAIHPFREGNGRTQREFTSQLASEAGYRINWGRVTREQMYDASIESHNLAKNSSFAALIRSSIEPR
jgi:cell filamentation protein